MSNLNIVPDGKTWYTSTMCIEEANAQKYAKIQTVIALYAMIFCAGDM